MAKKDLVPVNRYELTSAIKGWVHENKNRRRSYLTVELVEDTGRATGTPDFGLVIECRMIFERWGKYYEVKFHRMRECEVDDECDPFEYLAEPEAGTILCEQVYRKEVTKISYTKKP